jgi:hypothetical protein
MSRTVMEECKVRMFENTLQMTNLNLSKDSRMEKIT